MRALAVTLAACALMACAMGCSGYSSTNGYERFMPTEAAAQKALATALTAWQNGQPPGLLAAEPVPVVAVDAEWARGERLQSFSVLGESAGSGPRTFVVRLKLESRRAEINARFVVFGQDPLWVFRHEELEMMAHMEHPASDAASAAKSKSPEASPHADLPIDSRR